MLDRAKIEALVTAILAVNSFSVARVQELLPAFEREGLFDPDVVVALDRLTFQHPLRHGRRDQEAAP